MFLERDSLKNTPPFLTYHINQIILNFFSFRRATFINIKLYIEGREVIDLSFNGSCKGGIIMCVANGGHARSIRFWIR